MHWSSAFVVLVALLGVAEARASDDIVQEAVVS